MARRPFVYVALALAMMTVFSFSAAHADTNSQFRQSDPVLVIGAYFRAINSGDYQTAYSYWQQPDKRTEPQFAQGFADTTSARLLVRLPVFVDAGAGNFYARIPTWVIANHVDGSTHYYAGCFTLHKTDVPIGNATFPDLNWYIQTGDLQEQSTLNLSFLDTSCQGIYNFGSGLFQNQRISPIMTIQGYFDALATARTIPAAVKAAAYWVRLGGDMFQIDYSDQLAATSGLDLFIDPTVTFSSASQATFPVVLNVAAQNGAPWLLAGCLSTSILDVPKGNLAATNPNWYITDGTFAHASDEQDAISELGSICQS